MNFCIDVRLVIKTLILYITVSFVCTTQLPDILWDPANPIYNETLCGSASKRIYVKESDTINIVCSNRDLNNGFVSNSRRAKRDFFYDIHVTDKRELYSDRKTGNQHGDAVNTVYRCRETLHSDSNSLVKSSVEKYPVIFSPWGNANGRKFEPGKTYYFFTTSDGTEESLKNKRAPLETQHMGFEVYVCKSDELCKQRSRVNRCVGKPATEERLLDDDSSSPQWSTTAITITIILALVCGFGLGLLLDRVYQINKGKWTRKVAEDTVEEGNFTQNDGNINVQESTDLLDKGKPSNSNENETHVQIIVPS